MLQVGCKCKCPQTMGVSGKREAVSHEHGWRGDSGKAMELRSGVTKDERVQGVQELCWTEVRFWHDLAEYL